MGFDFSALFPDTIQLHSGATAYQADTGGYWIDFVPKGPELVISFDHMGVAGATVDKRRDFWGHSYFKKRNYSVLGVKWKKLDWYRGKDLHSFFRSAAFRTFAAQFSRHAWIGTSMGGFAALAFAEVLPGSLIFAQNPQSTLDPGVVPWEKRYGLGSSQDWSGDFADTAAAPLASRKIYLLYDPLERYDCRHAQRIRGPNVVDLKLPFGGHGAVKLLPQMNLLSEITDLALTETLTAGQFAKLVRARRSVPLYYQQMFTQVKTEARKQLVLARGLQLQPRSGELLALAIRHNFLNGKFEACVALFSNGADASVIPAEKDALVKACVGIAMSRLHYPIEQIKKLVGAKDVESAGAHELILQGEFLHIVREYDRSARLCNLAIKRNPRMHGGYRCLALVQVAQGSIEEALATINEAERSCGLLGAQMKIMKAKLQAAVSAKRPAQSLRDAESAGADQGAAE